MPDSPVPLVRVCELCGSPLSEEALFHRRCYFQQLRTPPQVAPPVPSELDSEPWVPMGAVYALAFGAVAAAVLALAFFVPALVRPFTR